MVFIKKYSQSIASYYFNLWRSNVKIIRSYRDYDTWCENIEERLQDVEFAIKNGMDPIFWCFNCKYCECEIHH